MVKAGVDNHAARLYQDELGVKPMAEIAGLFSRPELILVGPEQFK